MLLGLINSFIFMFWDIQQEFLDYVCDLDSPLTASMVSAAYMAGARSMFKKFLKFTSTQDSLPPVGALVDMLVASSPCYPRSVSFQTGRYEGDGCWRSLDSLLTLTHSIMPSDSGVTSGGFVIGWRSILHDSRE